MNQREFIESYTKQQTCVTKMLYAMKNNDTEVLAKYTPILLLEVFKNHSLTDAKSAETIDKITDSYLMAENKRAKVPSIEIEEDEEEDEKE